MKFWAKVGSLLIELIKFVKNVFFILLFVGIVSFFLMIFMKEQTTYAIEFFLKLLKIP